MLWYINVLDLTEHLAYIHAAGSMGGKKEQQKKALNLNMQRYIAYNTQPVIHNMLNFMSIDSDVKYVNA